MLLERVRREYTESSSSSTSSMFEKKGEASKFPNVPSPILSKERRRLSKSESRTLPPFVTDKSWESRLEAS
jgi:hypothetical protein